LLKATTSPSESPPPIAWRPPDQTTMTIPTLTHSVRSGVIAAVNCITRTERAVRSSLADSKRADSCSARTKAFTRRAPATFSWSTALSRSRRCCTVRKRGSILTTKYAMRPVVTASSGSIVRARRGLVRTISARLPSMRSGARVPMRRDTWVSVLSALTSLVRRTRSCPVPCRSRSAKDHPCTSRKSASRRSRATPSPARTEAALLPTAMTALRAEIASIAAAVRATAGRSRRRMPSSMMCWMSRGIARSRSTSAPSEASESATRAR
jgi:hypothetical protein